MNVYLLYSLQTFLMQQSKASLASIALIITIKVLAQLNNIEQMLLNSIIHRFFVGYQWQTKKTSKDTPILA